MDVARAMARGALSVVCLSVCVAGEAVTRGGELVRNGGFADWSGAAPVGWEVGKSVRVEKETVDTPSAPFALKLTGAGAISSLKGNWLLQRKVFRPGVAYSVSVRAKRLSGLGPLSVGMGYHGIGMARSSGQWVQVSFEARGHATYDVLVLGADENAVWLIDDVSVRELDIPESVPGEAAEVSDTAPVNGARGKKLIRAGGYNYPDLIRREIRNMERLPFDGTMIKLHDWRNSMSVFRPEPFDESTITQDFEDLRRIEWKRFTHNFIRMITAKREHPRQDWFDDTHWDAIVHNVRVVAKAARAGRCVGVCFDAEAYGPNPWAYQEAAHRLSRTFAEHEAMVRKRGAQFVQAIEGELPDARILTYVLLSQLRGIPPWTSVSEREGRLSTDAYGLLPAFVNGMLDGAGAGVTIIDGNEGSYYYSSREEFLGAYHCIVQRAMRFVDPSHAAKYRAQVRAGQAVYLNECLGLRERRNLARYLDASEQRLLLEHNTYWALYTTDEIAWLYDEKVDWWTGRGLPDGAIEAVASARRKIDGNEALGFDLTPVIARAQATFDREMSEGLEQRSAAIARLPAAVAPPRIDGLLRDPAWEKGTLLVPFVPPALAGKAVTVATRARVTYDRECLYISVECQEPDPAKMQVLGDGRDHEDLWRGDDVEVFLAVSDTGLPYRHFMVNPAGGYWDSLKPEAGLPEDMTYDPEWRKAAQVGTNSWSVEAAIPWEALGIGAPEGETSLRANICRSRTQNGERSMWSPTRKSFVEPERFGVWRFGE